MYDLGGMSNSCMMWEGCQTVVRSGEDVKQLYDVGGMSNSCMMWEGCQTVVRSGRDVKQLYDVGRDVKQL